MSGMANSLAAALRGGWHTSPGDRLPSGRLVAYLVVVFGHVALNLPATVAADASHKGRAATVRPVVEVEQEVYRYAPADNGAGPMWCHGSTCIVRAGGRVFASGIETLPDVKPLCNCQPMLWMQTSAGWKQIYRDNGRTREPCPMATFADGSVFMSINPTLTPPDAYNGPARPAILEFAAATPDAEPKSLLPVWNGKPTFTEHSYRSFAADGQRGELLLLQNVGYTHVEWSFRDSHGRWSAAGKLRWPWGAEYDKPQPIRVCYPTVALSSRRVFFCGVSDIIEPYQVWREYKKKLTGREWDYDFRRLFLTWSDDITTGKFHDWVEVASRDKTCGWISPADLYVLPGGNDLLILWTERTLDERLREKFFPKAKQRHALEMGLVRSGKLVRRTTLVEGGEGGLGGQRPGSARFHVLPDGRLFACYFVSGSDDQGKSLHENRLVEVLPDGSLGKPMTVPLKQPLSSFFNATVRAGNQPSPWLDLLGTVDRTLRYARIRLVPAKPPTASED
jgi:hypothetical protein